MSSAHARLILFSLLTSVMCSCDPFHIQLRQVIEQVVATREFIQKTNGEWQWKLDALKNDLTRDSNDIARGTVQDIDHIMNQTVANAGIQARCTAASLKSMTVSSLTNLVHKLKGEHLDKIDPEICDVEPKVIDLANSQKRMLSITGSFFFSSEKPQVRIRAKNGDTKTIPSAYVLRETDYTLIVRLEEMERDRFLAGESSVLLVSFPNRTVPQVHEIPIQWHPQCENGYIDGFGTSLETDIDCGGDTCVKCSVGRACRSDNDCATGVCEKTRCGTHHIGDASTEALFGGNGAGNGDLITQCPIGFVAVGFHAFTGNWFDRFGLRCADLTEAGRVGIQQKDTEMVGDPGGKNQGPPSMCADGRVLNGITGTVYDGPSSVKGLCAMPFEIAKAPDILSTKDVSALINPSGQGSPAIAQCPAGYAVTGFHVHFVDIVSRLFIRCSQVQRVAAELPH